MYNRIDKSKFSLKCHLIFVVKYRHPLLKHVKISTNIKETILAAQTTEFTVDIMEVDVDHIHSCWRSYCSTFASASAGDS